MICESSSLELLLGIFSIVSIYLIAFSYSLYYFPNIKFLSYSFKAQIK